MKLRYQQDNPAQSPKVAATHTQDLGLLTARSLPEDFVTNPSLLDFTAIDAAANAAVATVLLLLHQHSDKVCRERCRLNAVVPPHLRKHRSQQLGCLLFRFHGMLLQQLV